MLLWEQDENWGWGFLGSSWARTASWSSLWFWCWSCGWCWCFGCSLSCWFGGWSFFLCLLFLNLLLLVSLSFNIRGKSVKLLNLAILINLLSAIVIRLFHYTIPSHTIIISLNLYKDFSRNFFNSVKIFSHISTYFTKNRSTRVFRSTELALFAERSTKMFFFCSVNFSLTLRNNKITGFCTDFLNVGWRFFLILLIEIFNKPLDENQIFTLQFVCLNFWLDSILKYSFLHSISIAKFSQILFTRSFLFVSSCTSKSVNVLMV